MLEVIVISDWVGREYYLWPCFIINTLIVPSREENLAERPNENLQIAKHTVEPRPWILPLCRCRDKMVSVKRIRSNGLPTWPQINASNIWVFVFLTLTFSPGNVSVRMTEMKSDLRQGDSFKQTLIPESVRRQDLDPAENFSLNYENIFEGRHNNDLLKNTDLKNGSASWLSSVLAASGLPSGPYILTVNPPSGVDSDLEVRASLLQQEQERLFLASTVTKTENEVTALRQAAS